MCISGYVFQALLGYEKRKNVVRINHKVLLVKRYHKLLCAILFGRNLNVKHGRGSQTIMALIIGRVNVLDVMVITTLGYWSRIWFREGSDHVLMVGISSLLAIIAKYGVPIRE